MKKIILIVIVLSIFIIAGCAQQPSQPSNPPIAQEPAAKEPEQVCTEMWICANENTKAYRKSDCSFEQITDCPGGCENAECKAVQPKEEKPQEEPKEEPKQTAESCTIGWKCLDDKRLGYQSSNCMFDNVEQCQYGCKGGACIQTAPKEEEKEETFSLIEGTAKFDRPGWRYSDFGKNQIFLEEVYDFDVKIKLYASASSYNYFRAESPRSHTWVIDKGIKEAIRPDCVENIKDENSYQYLRTERTLCIKTREDNIALIGGYWEGLPTEDTELTWRYYTPK